MALDKRRSKAVQDMITQNHIEFEIIETSWLKISRKLRRATEKKRLLVRIVKELCQHRYKLTWKRGFLNGSFPHGDLNQELDKTVCVYIGLACLTVKSFTTQMAPLLILRRRRNSLPSHSVKLLHISTIGGPYTNSYAIQMQ
jgi:hypothetical protein